jgi:hypothetical protein
MIDSNRKFNPLKIEKEELNKDLKCAEIAGKTSMKRKIIIGAVELTIQSLEEKFGGVVLKKVKRLLVASSISMMEKSKKMKKKKMKRKKSFKTKI